MSAENYPTHGTAATSIKIFPKYAIAVSWREAQMPIKIGCVLLTVLICGFEQFFGCFKGTVVFHINYRLHHILPPCGSRGMIIAPPYAIRKTISAAHKASQCCRKPLCPQNRN